MRTEVLKEAYTTPKRARRNPGRPCRTEADGGDESEAARAELAQGWAFWAGRSRTVPGVDAPGGELAPAEALSGIPHLSDQTGVIASRLPKLGGLAGWSPAVSALRGPTNADEAMSVLADTATDVFARTGNPDVLTAALQVGEFIAPR